MALLALSSRASTTVYQHFAYYDESELPGGVLPTGTSDVYGVFIYPTLDVAPIFTIERMRFWHLEQNGEPDPYRVHLVVRNTAAQHVFVIDTSEAYMTTCTGCWEEVIIEQSFWDNSTEGWSFGVFMQPQGQHGGQGEPIIRFDSSPSAPLHNLWSGYTDWAGFENLIYPEDWSQGNFFMEIIVRYDEPTAVLSTSLSAVKALY